ncbi:hypothetical protein FHG87_015631 [Trinorchestia longiramus]|nr:hypothetical protein FHG87_015631 [Trinorchestia longiramus]
MRPTAVWFLVHHSLFCQSQKTSVTQVLSVKSLESLKNANYDCWGSRAPWVGGQPSHNPQVFGSCSSLLAPTDLHHF